LEAESCVAFGVGHIEESAMMVRGGDGVEEEIGPVVASAKEAPLGEHLDATTNVSREFVLGTFLSYLFHLIKNDGAELVKASAPFLLFLTMLPFLKFFDLCWLILVNRRADLALSNKIQCGMRVGLLRVDVCVRLEIEKTTCELWVRVHCSNIVFYSA
jgi:hypothetical protein